MLSMTSFGDQQGSVNLPAVRKSEPESAYSLFQNMCYTPIMRQHHCDSIFVEKIASLRQIWRGRIDEPGLPSPQVLEIAHFHREIPWKSFRFSKELGVSEPQSALAGTFTSLHGSEIDNFGEGKAAK